MATILDSIRRTACGLAYPDFAVNASAPRAFERGRTLIRLYYLVMVGLALKGLLSGGSQRLNPSFALWPLMWTHFAAAWSKPIVQFLFLTGSLSAAAFPEKRWARILAFVGCLQFGAYVNSFGKINHSFHLWVVTAGLLIFLPALGKGDRKTEEGDFLLVIWYAQAFVLMTYTMAGLQKILSGALQWIHGDRYWLLSPESLSIHVASRFLDMDRSTYLGSRLIDHPNLGFAIMLSALYLEVFSLRVAFRSDLHRTWGALLILMHLCILAIMDLGFLQAMLLLAVLVAGSPFSAPGFRWTMVPAFRLPWFGTFLEACAEKSGNAFRGNAAARPIPSLVFFDGECGWCQRWILFLIRKGLPRHISFASLQGALFQDVLSRHPHLAYNDSLTILSGHGEGSRIRVRSEAVFWLYGQLPGLLGTAILGLLIPSFIRDSGYRLAAVLRTRFPASVSCDLPQAGVLERFKD